MKNNLELDKFRFFIVDDDNERRSSVWIIWLANNSLYICPEKLGGSFKISLHPDANDGKGSQIGLSRDYRIKLEIQGFKGPKPIRWLRPSPRSNGATQVITIFYPTDFLRANIKNERELSNKKKIKFAIPVAKAGEAVEINLFYCFGKSEEIEKLFAHANFTVLGFFLLQSGEMIFITARHRKFNSKFIPDLNNGKITSLLGAPKTGESVENTHGLLFSEPFNGQPLFIAEINGLNIRKGVKSSG